MMKSGRASALALTVAAALGLSATPTFADETFTLATSKAHMLHVLADGGAGWCKPNVHLRIVLEAGSPDAGKPEAQIAMMNRLKTAIESECKAATAAEITVTGPGAAPGTFTATAAGAWTFAGLSPPSTPLTSPETESQTATVPPIASANPPPRFAEKPPTTAPAPVPVAPSVSPIAEQKLPQPYASSSSPPAPIPPQTPALFPRDHDYASAMLAYVKETPALADDDNILKYWASYRYQQLYQQVWDQEFKLRQLLNQARTDLADAISQIDENLVTVVLSTDFGEYDFKTHRFPISINAHQVTLQSATYLHSAPPRAFIIHVPDFDLIQGLGMDAAAAQEFVEKRTRYRNVNRSILVAITIKLDRHGFAKDNGGNLIAEGILERAALFDDIKAQQAIYQISAAEFVKMRADKTEKIIAVKKEVVEQQHRLRVEQDKRQREQNILILANTSVATRLANWISTDPLNFSASLNALRLVRAKAVLDGRPVSVAMLVQMDASGTKNVDTKWPGHLQVSVADPAAELKSSAWYLVAGELIVPEGDALPTTQLSATAVYGCAQPMCAEATDATAIVDRKSAALIKLQ